MENSIKTLELYLYSTACMVHHTIEGEDGVIYQLQIPDVYEQEYFYICIDQGKWYFRFAHERKRNVLCIHHMYQYEFKKGQMIRMFAMSYQQVLHQMYPYHLCKNKIYIGRGEEHDIVINHPYVSMLHAILRYENNTLYIDDCESRNGIYVNKERIKTCQLNCGDIIYIMHIMVIIGEDFILLPAHAQRIEMKQWTPYLKNFNCKIVSGTAVWIHAMPFPIPIMEEYHPHYDAPEYMQEQEQIPMWLSLGPSFMMGFSSLSMAIFTLIRMQMNGQDQWQGIPTIIMSLSMALSTMVWPIIQRRLEQRRSKQMKNAYLQAYQLYLEQKKEEHVQYCLRKKAYIEQYFESTEKACIYVNDKPELLFHRQCTDVSWLHLVLGTGNVRADIIFDYPKKGFQFLTNDLYEKMLFDIQSPYILSTTSIVFDLLKERTLGVVGNEDNSVRYVCMLILQLVILHDPNQLTLIIVGDEALIHQYNLAWIPHVCMEDRRLLICHEQSARSIQSFIDIHKKELCQQTIVVLSLHTMLDTYIPLFKEFIMDDTISYTYIQCVAHREQLQSYCHSYVMLHDHHHQLILQQKIQNFEQDLYSKEKIVECFQKISLCTTYKIHKTQKKPIISFLDLYGCANVKQLQIAHRWKHNDIVNSLKAIIGFDQDQQPIYLDVHESKHGPHGLIAGTTGSGKSECIMTYILSLSITYTSEEVSFFIIDYKGGMMASALEPLPHVVNILTNLNDDMLIRAHHALDFELKRRQELLVKTAKQQHVPNIDIHEYQTLFKTKKVALPLPHLFIIADEFAELKQQHPDFLNQLKQIARIGRSLGIHLILATQKPGGIVDDQIWSNARFHICLRVQDRSDSMEVLKRDDAADLVQTGAFYLQVGNNEHFLMGQSAWVQAPYEEREFYDIQHSDEITFLDITLMKQTSIHINDDQQKRERQLSAVIREVCNLQQKLQISCSQLMKLPCKASKISLEARRKGMLCIGMIDDIFTQRQYECKIKWKQSILICGKLEEDQFWFLKNIIIGLMNQPMDISVYIIDMEGSFNEQFKQYIIIEDILLATETQRIDTLFHLLERSMQKNVPFINHDVIIILHGFDQFHELCANWEPLIIRLLREGDKHNFYLYITVQDPQIMPYRIISIVKSVYVMKLKNKHDYTTILHAKQLRPLNQAGSGIMLVDQHEVLFQLGFHDENIQQRYCDNDKIHKHEILSLPTHVTIPKEDLGGVCLGLDLIYKEYVCLPWKMFYHLYIFAYHSVSISFVNGLLKQFQYDGNESCTLFQHFSGIYLWCSDIDHAMHNENQKKCFECNAYRQIVIGNASNVRLLSSYAWFQKNLMNAAIVLVGKGVQDMAYQLQVNYPLQQQVLSDEQAFLWVKGEDVRCIQLIEVM